MKKDKCFRYSLQFPGDTPEQLRVGELLERLGSKKSRFIVRVLSEYMESHPELLEPDVRIQIQSGRSGGYSRTELRSILKELLEEQGYILKADSVDAPVIAAGNIVVFESGNADVDDMLDNLSVFLE